jgi:uncharacterized membrane protein YphA (DoxX/SURF4 family)
MNLQALLTDPFLCLCGFIFLAVWAGIKTKAGKSGLKGDNHGWESRAATFLRVLSGLILIFASRDKLGDAASFAQMVTNYQLLSPHLIPLASVVIPWLEFFTGLFLVFGFRYRGAAFVFCALMGLYAFAIAFDLLRGVDINCGCGLTDPSENATWWSVLRDLEFFSIGYIVLVSPPTHASLDGWKGQ